MIKLCYRRYALKYKMSSSGVHSISFIRQHSNWIVILFDCKFSVLLFLSFTMSLTLIAPQRNNVCGQATAVRWPISMERQTKKTNIVNAHLWGLPQTANETQRRTAQHRT